jgi:hypothetical protein
MAQTHVHRREALALAGAHAYMCMRASCPCAYALNASVFTHIRHSGAALGEFYVYADGVPVTCC